MPSFTAGEVAQAHERIALQQSLGLDVEWLASDDIDSRETGLAPGATLGASYAPGTATSTRPATCWPTRRR